MNFKGFTKMDFLYKKLTHPELDILKDYIRKKSENQKKELRKEMGEEFKKWFLKGTEMVEDAIERITGVKV